MGNLYARALSLAGVIATVLVTLAGGASAATGSPAPAGKMVKEPMAVVGFDASVAAAHGYALRKEANGKTELVNIRTRSVVPNNTLKGACGYSWYYISRRNARTWTFWTGFHIYSHYGTAVDYTWHTHVAGPARYSQSDDFGGVLNFDSTWQSKNVRFHSFGRRGVYHGVVSSGHAITDLGFVCYTEHPSASLKH